MKRSSGILMPMSALPGEYGIGGMGSNAYKFIDFLKASGQSYWQLLPLGPTSYGDSPYSSFSTFAGNPYFIDLESLIKSGLIKKSELSKLSWGDKPDEVDYSSIYSAYSKALHMAFESGWDTYADEIRKFRRENSAWLENYALYMALKEHFDMLCWTDWPEEDIRLHKESAVAKYRKLLSGKIDYYVFVQYLFYSQWEKLRSYAKKNNIKFIGDIPIYVAMDSADVWSEPGFFQLDEKNLPREVAGVPPDGFTPDGQLWGNPLYDWDALKKDGYGWWIRRIDGAGRLYDVVRIDHFRGFESYWAVPYGDETAANGKWRKGPGMDLVGVLTSWFNSMSFIAEDLGYVTPEVQALLTDSGLPGMAVLEFAFYADTDSGYLPHNIVPNSVCYAGTHDNNTVLGWEADMEDEDREFARRYMNISEEEGWSWGLIRTGMASPAKLFIAQMQDILALDASARMNTPGTDSGNWKWRMLPDALDAALAEKLLSYTETFRRAPESD